MVFFRLFIRFKFWRSNIAEKIIILLTLFMVSCIFCGAASAATVNQTSTAKIIKSGASDNILQNLPAVDGTKVVWVQVTSNGTTAILYKDIAYYGPSGKVLSSKLNQTYPAISGSMVVWQQQISKTVYSIYYRNFATGISGRVLSSKFNQTLPSISGNTVVWEQMNSKGLSSIYYKYFNLE